MPANIMLRLMRTLRLFIVPTLGLIVAACAAHPALIPQPTSHVSVERFTQSISTQRIGSGFGTFQEYAVPNCPRSGNCSPNGMALGINKRVWFGNQFGGAIDSIDSIGSIRIHTVDKSEGFVNFDVAEASDHTMWFTAWAPDGSHGTIGHLADGSVTLYPQAFMPTFIIRGIENMWFSGTNHISKISSTGAVTTFTLDPNSNPGELVRGPDGNVWFTDEYIGSQIQSRVGKITPTGKVTEFVVPDKTPGGIIGITVGPDANLWFTDGSTTNGITQIGMCTLSGVITMYDTPTTHATAWGITSGPSNDLYFTETGANQIGRVTLNPVRITEYVVPPPSVNPLDIALGADNNIWFTIPGVNLIGEFETH